MADIMLYENHPDPHLRGISRTLICNFILAVLNEHNFKYNEWVEGYCCDDNFDRFRLDSLLKMIIKVSIRFFFVETSILYVFVGIGR